MMKTIARPYRTVFLLLFLLFLLTSLFITPYGDDWGYKTEPRFYNSLSAVNLLPAHGKWRPLDSLWGALMSLLPWAYPALNHATVVTGHFISALLLFLFGQRFGFSEKSSFFAALIFLLSGNTFATVFSIDSLNQSLSLTFGLLSVWNCIRSEKIHYLAYILWSILSVCAKESGFFFFIIGPVFHFILNHRTAGTLKKINFRIDILPVITGVLLTLLYFSFTFGGDLIGNMKNSIHSRPSFMNPSLYNLPFGTVALVARAFPLDLPALLLTPRAPLIFVISIAGALPLFAVLVYQTVRFLFKGDLFVVFLIPVILVFALSHASVNAITEMNSYPCIFFTCCLFLPTLDAIASHRKAYYVLLSLFFLASGTSLIHKYILIRKGNRLASVVTDHIVRQTTRIPNRVYILQIDVESLGHDIYQPIPPIAAGSGQIMKYIWKKWDLQTDIVSCQVHTDGSELVQAPELLRLTPEKADSILYDLTQKKLRVYDAVWRIYPDGKVEVAEQKHPSGRELRKKPL